MRVLCEVGLLSFSIRACIGLSTCSLREVGLVGPETRVLITFAVDALSYVWPLLVALRLTWSVVLSCVESVLLTPRHVFCLPWLWVLSFVRPVVWALRQVCGFDVHFFGKAGVLGSQARVVSSLGVGVLII